MCWSERRNMGEVGNETYTETQWMGREAYVVSKKFERPAKFSFFEI